MSEISDNAWKKAFLRKMIRKLNLRLHHNLLQGELRIHHIIFLKSETHGFLDIMYFILKFHAFFELNFNLFNKRIIHVGFFFCLFLLLNHFLCFFFLFNLLNNAFAEVKMRVEQNNRGGEDRIDQLGQIQDISLII